MQQCAACFHILSCEMKQRAPCILISYSELYIFRVSGPRVTYSAYPQHLIEVLITFL